MPRAITHTGEKYRINRERYRVLTALGATWQQASSARCPVRFVELVVAQGGNPADYPELTVVRQGGRPRNPTARNQAINHRYHVLRQAGASAQEACDGSKGDGAMAVMLRRLAKRKGASGGA